MQPSLNRLSSRFSSIVKGGWSQNPVLVMNNASFCHSDRIMTLCADAGVKLLYLLPYSPDFNPIEEFFAELKAYIKNVWSAYEEIPTKGFTPSFGGAYMK